MTLTVYESAAVPGTHECRGQVEYFREAFNQFDSDGGGSIDIEELGACLRTLGQVQHRHVPITVLTSARPLFCKVFTQQSAVSDTRKGCWQNLSEPELADMLSEFDTDNTQTINFDGFLGKNNP